MKRVVTTTIGLLSLVALTMEARAIVGDTTENPYHAIVERNVFDLKKPDPPAALTNAPATPPPNVKLTGITTVLGPKKALFMVKDVDTPGKPPNKEESVILREGERQGALEVLEINEKAETVRIKNDGTVSVLTFEKAKLPSAPAVQPTAMAGGPTQPRIPTFVPPQAGNPGYNPQVTPTSYPIVPNNPGAAANNYNNGLSSIPTRTLRTGQDEANNMSAEEATTLALANQQANQDKIARGEMPPLPPPPGMANPGAQNQNQNSGPGLAPPATPNIPPDVLARINAMRSQRGLPPLPGQ
jgi:hypothetical protein